MERNTLSRFEQVSDSELESVIGGKFSDRDAGLAYGRMVGLVIKGMLFIG